MELRERASRPGFRAALARDPARGARARRWAAAARDWAPMGDPEARRVRDVVDGRRDRNPRLERIEVRPSPFHPSRLGAAWRRAWRSRIEEVVAMVAFTASTLRARTATCS